jgi:hypothetical protein
VLCHRGELEAFAPDQGEEKSDSMIAAEAIPNRSWPPKGSPALREAMI